MFRIKKYPIGYVVEIKKRKWYGKEYWTHYISYSGYSDKPYCFNSFEFAKQELLLEIGRDVFRNS